MCDLAKDLRFDDKDKDKYLKSKEKDKGMDLVQ